MIELISDKVGEIAGICSRLAVRRLHVFGSAVSGNFDPLKSDVDFIVEFTNHAKPGILKRYLALAEGLESILDRRVDLITQESIKNPFFLEEVETTKKVIYEA